MLSLLLLSFFQVSSAGLFGLGEQKAQVKKGSKTPNKKPTSLNQVATKNTPKTHRDINEDTFQRLERKGQKELPKDLLETANKIVSTKKTHPFLDEGFVKEIIKEGLYGEFFETYKNTKIGEKTVIELRDTHTADPDKKGDNIFHKLIRASELFETAIFEEIYEKREFQYLINKTNEKGVSPFFLIFILHLNSPTLASEFIVQAIFEKKIKLNLSLKDKNGNNILHHIAKSFHPENVILYDQIKEQMKKDGLTKNHLTENKYGQIPEAMIVTTGNPKDIVSMQTEGNMHINENYIRAENEKKIEEAIEKLKEKLDQGKSITEADFLIEVPKEKSKVNFLLTETFLKAPLKSPHILHGMSQNNTLNLWPKSTNELKTKGNEYSILQLAIAFSADLKFIDHILNKTDFDLNQNLNTKNNFLSAIVKKAFYKLTLLTVYKFIPISQDESEQNKKDFESFKKIFFLLVDKGLNLKFKDSMGNTILHTLAYFYFMTPKESDKKKSDFTIAELFEYLLQGDYVEPEDLKVKNKKGKNVLDIIEKNQKNNQELKKIIESVYKKLQQKQLLSKSETTNVETIKKTLEKVIRFLESQLDLQKQSLVKVRNNPSSAVVALRLKGAIERSHKLIAMAYGISNDLENDKTFTDAHKANYQKIIKTIQKSKQNQTQKTGCKAGFKK